MGREIDVLVGSRMGFELVVSGSKKGSKVFYTGSMWDVKYFSW